MADGFDGLAQVLAVLQSSGYAKTIEAFLGEYAERAAAAGAVPGTIAAGDAALGGDDAAAAFLDEGLIDRCAWRPRPGTGTDGTLARALPAGRRRGRRRRRRAAPPAAVDG
jgi:hypothetical protein